MTYALVMTRQHKPLISERPGFDPVFIEQFPPGSIKFSYSDFFFVNSIFFNLILVCYIIL